MPEVAKTARLFGGISQTKVMFRKYLIESCSSELFLQLSFNIFFLFALHSKVIYKSMTGQVDSHQLDLQASGLNGLNKLTKIGE